MANDKPDFSNVVAGSSSTAPAPAGDKTAVAARTYVVQKGDTLSKIANKFYGTTTQWPVIYEANRDRIKDPDLIQPGWSLTIPAVAGREQGGAS
jgi:Ca2+-transporting ATPase